MIPVVTSSKLKDFPRGRKEVNTLSLPVCKGEAWKKTNKQTNKHCIPICRIKYDEKNLKGIFGKNKQKNVKKRQS